MSTPVQLTRTMLGLGQRGLLHGLSTRSSRTFAHLTPRQQLRNKHNPSAASANQHFKYTSKKMALWKSSKEVSALEEGSPYINYNNPISQLDDNRDLINVALQNAHCNPDEFGMKLRLWDGPLSGIVHQSGQYSEVTKDASPDEDSSKVTPSVKEGVQADLEQLLAMRQHSQHVFYDDMGSESEYSLLPIILHPPSSHSCTVNESDKTEDADAGSKSEAGSKSGAGADVLTAEQVFQALDIGADINKLFREPERFSSAESFVKHMKRMIKLEAAEEEGADEMFIKSKQHFLQAVELLATAAQAPFFKIVVGHDTGMFNPVPVLWLGKSEHGNIIGLMSAVVWT